jgi:hypothetical protein
MWFMAFTFRMWHNMRPGGAIRGKWRIPDGKMRVDYFLVWSSEGGTVTCVD